MSRCESARQGCGLIDVDKWLGVGRNGGFVGCKDGAKGGNGFVVEGGQGQWSKGEGCTKVTGEGIDEERVAFVLSEVGAIISKKDLAKGGGKGKANSKLGDGEVLREAGWVAKGGAKAVTGIEDGDACPTEGEVARADVAEGGLGGGVMGGEGCKVGDGVSVGGAEEAFVVREGEDVFVP